LNPGIPLAQMRLAQEVALLLPNVGMATVIDLGDFNSPEGNIHPRDKETVGERLSWTARAIFYGDNVPYLGPTFSGFSVEQGTTLVNGLREMLELHEISQC
jgi:sialate O-acetylesterase